MASGPITSWEIDGETAETVSDFIFGGYKILRKLKLQLMLYYLLIDHTERFPSSLV